MLYSLFTHMERCTPEEVQRLLLLVSNQRRQQALRFSHTFGRFCCLQSFCMLQTLLSSVSPTLDENMPDWVYGPCGKPALPPELEQRTGLFFSISHTKNAILVAIDGRPIGVDVEQLRHPSPSLVSRTMNEAEQRLISAAANPDAAFTALWTQKEAVLKLRGTGILDDLSAVLPAPDAVLQTRIDPARGLAMTIATLQKE